MEILLFLYLVIIFIKYSLETKILLNENNTIDLYFKKNFFLSGKNPIFLDNMLYILMNFPVEQIQKLIKINYEGTTKDEMELNITYEIIDECGRILNNKSEINIFFSFLDNDDIYQYNKYNL